MDMGVFLNFIKIASGVEAAGNWAFYIHYSQLLFLFVFAYLEMLEEAQMNIKTKVTQMSGELNLKTQTNKKNLGF